ncbi:TreK [Staphylococcus phage vB_SsapH-Golestan101-M]|nr:TreK [Staphylococcus phage vB_SsapH-Golestan101-M]
MTKKNYVYKETHTVQNKEIEVFRIENDVNGNPRYVVHFLYLDIKLSDYDNINKLYSFKKYRAKWFGGGVVFQSYNIADTLKYALDTVKEIEAVKN